MGTRFEQQMLLEADERPGRYRVDVDEAWNCPIVPHGGLVTAIAARAMAMELDTPEQPLRSVNAVFADQVRPGPATVDVTVLRRGRSISQLSATIRSDGQDAGLTAIGVFGAPRPGFDFVDVAPPRDVPPPEQCRSWRQRLTPVRQAFAFNFWEHVENRLAAGHFPDEEWEPTDSERLQWYRFEEPPLDEEGFWDPLAILTMGDTMPGAVGEKTGPGHPMWLPPSCDLTVHLFGTTRAEWILGRNRARWAGDGYASVDMELWDPDGRLLAYATQVMFLVFPEGLTPPPAPAR
ncbi:MAG TPA: thioesterase family protein [Acidimicrobiales bacterium]|nr:thioesterase family protein [Acidimicrobiales bacterium]